jgi:hypothetical protein
MELVVAEVTTAVVVARMVVREVVAVATRLLQTLSSQLEVMQDMAV